ARLEPLLARLVDSGRLLEGEFRPGGSGRGFCDAEVLRRLRRQTLAHLRKQVAAVDGGALARFLPRWHGTGRAHAGMARVREVVEQLEGLSLPLSDLERTIFPARVREFQPRMLDELGAAGELVWVGRGALGPDDGRVALFRRDHVGALLDPMSA